MIKLFGYRLRRSSPIPGGIHGEKNRRAKKIYVERKEGSKREGTLIYGLVAVIQDKKYWKANIRGVLYILGNFINIKKHWIPIVAVGVVLWEIIKALWINN